MSTIRTLLSKTFLKRFMYRHSFMVSQIGQEYWVFGEAFNEKKHGYFLDIGAHDGVHLSNTYLLESKYNWSGICIEANPVTFKKLKRNRRAECLNICLDRSEGEVNFVLRGEMGGIVDQDLDNKESHTINNKVIKLKTMSLNRVLGDKNELNSIDYLSIDAEGAEERILAEFDFHKYTFKCITIERPSKLLQKLFQSHGYIKIKENPDMDFFYVHQTFIKEYKKNLRDFYRKKYLKIRWR
ncbi:MAG: FkbM family methyltransferase [Bacteroidetes bacterium]|nr:MAG: FkbM family methyltransferase [Bacteroidota bacterium]